MLDALPALYETEPLADLQRQRRLVHRISPELSDKPSRSKGCGETVVFILVLPTAYPTAGCTLFRHFKAGNPLRNIDCPALPTIHPTQ